MRPIEIDFDIHKLIEAERRSFSEAPNEALRRLLKLPEATAVEQQPEAKAKRAGRAWQRDGVKLPHGTQLRMTYNGTEFEGLIDDGVWVVGGKQFSSPSGAAGGLALTRNGSTTKLDGWRYWEVKRPGDTRWRLLHDLREEWAEKVTAGMEASKLNLDL